MAPDSIAEPLEALEAGNTAQVAQLASESSAKASVDLSAECWTLPGWAEELAFVRPYVVRWEQHQERALQEERRRALEAVCRGEDYPYTYPGAHCLVSA